MAIIKDIYNTVMGQNTSTPEQYNWTGSQDYKNMQADRELGMGSRAQQGQAMDFARRGMLGQGPSVAEQQMRAGQQQAMQNAQVMAASGRGTNQALANRNAALAQATLAGNYNRDAGMMRAAEQQAYAQQYSALANQMRAQDQARAGMALQSNMGGAGAYGQWLQAQTAVNEGNAQRGQQGVGGLIAMAGAGAALASDPTAKMDIQPAGTGYDPRFSEFGTPPSAVLRRAPSETLTQADQTQRAYGFDPNVNLDMGSPNIAPAPARTTMIAARPETTPAQAAPGQVAPAAQPAQGVSATDMGNSFNAGMSLFGGGRQGPPPTYVSPYQPVSDVQAKQDIMPVESDVKTKSVASTVPAARFADLSPEEQAHDALTEKLAAQDQANKQSHSAIIEEAAKVQPYFQRYKGEFAEQNGGERRLGIMANNLPGNLEENGIYASSIKPDERGIKHVDGGQAVVQNIAVTSELARELLKQRQELNRLKGDGSTFPTSYPNQRFDYPPMTEGTPAVDKRQVRVPGQRREGQTLGTGPGRLYDGKLIEKGSGVDTQVKRWRQYDPETAPIPVQSGIRTEGFAKPLKDQPPLDRDREKFERTPGQEERLEGWYGERSEQAPTVNEVIEDEAVVLRDEVMGKDPKVQKKALREVQQALSPLGRNTPNSIKAPPELVRDELEKRGVKIPLKKIKDALRHEVTL